MFGQLQSVAAVEIYDEFRTVELNKDYYEKSVAKIKRKIFWLNAISAIASSTSIINLFVAAANAFGTNTTPGFFVSGILVLIAALIQVIKPSLGWEVKAEKLSTILSTYKTMSHIYLDVVRDIKRKREITTQELAIYETLRKIRLSTDDTSLTDDQLVALLSEKVSKRYPVSYFYYPTPNVYVASLPPAQGPPQDELIDTISNPPEV